MNGGYDAGKSVRQPFFSCCAAVECVHERWKDGETYLEEDEHQHGVGPEAEERGRLALEEELRTLFAQRPLEHRYRRLARGLRET